MTPAEAALDYARRGWPVLRVKPLSKAPMTTAWQRAATTDAGLVAAWWQETPKANIGLLCGVAFDVLDIEAPAVAPLRDWMAQRGYRLPESPVAWSARGGFHVYCAPTGGRKRDLYLGALRLGEHRGIGAQVLAPPSRFHDPETKIIGTYTWALPPGDGPLPPAPAWVDLLRKPERPMAAVRPATRPRTVAEGLAKLDALAGALAGRTEGERNSYLFWAARRAYKEGHPAAVVDTVLARHAAAVGLEDHAIRATLESARRWAAR